MRVQRGRESRGVVESRGFACSCCDFYSIHMFILLFASSWRMNSSNIEGGFVESSASLKTLHAN